MMKNFWLAALVLVIVIGTSQGSAFQKRVHVQREFDLRVGREAIVKEAGLKVTFTEMVEDSRCPEGVDCIWAGNGKIKLAVRKGNHETVLFELNTMTAPTSVCFQDYEIALVKLAPYPKMGVETKKQNYVATLKVIKK